MKTVKFIPTACKEITDSEGVVHAPEFKGSITLKVPDYFERQKLKVFLMSAISKDGEIDIEVARSGGHGSVNILSLMDKMADLVKESVKFYQAVEIECIKSGVVYSSFEDMSSDNQCDSIIQEVAQELANGFALSKNS